MGYVCLLGTTHLPQSWNQSEHYHSNFLFHIDFHVVLAFYCIKCRKVQGFKERMLKRM